uniref:RING-CH-type domain-containing protein n=2 Tax=Lotharella globosa TaxID=91324 RepID=A0A7S3Y8H9_9EUKA|mmetsp:Transcript_25571/g.50043  ORF Transcript_25571/g.50043 Transcript_25571/m.50043 type:complete len:317 (-) Transcript_25571:72-1022(-)
MEDDAPLLVEMHDPSSTELGLPHDIGSLDEKPPEPSAPPRDRVEEEEDDDGDEKTCRICFDSENPETMIRPCRCSGGQKWIHRSCLDDWRSQDSIPHAFERCPTCHFNYITEVKTNEPTTAQKVKYWSLVTRDLLLLALAIVAAIFVLAFFAKLVDPKPKRPLLHIFPASWAEAHEAVLSGGPYLVMGIVLLLAIFGIIGAINMAVLSCHGAPIVLCDDNCSFFCCYECNVCLRGGCDIAQCECAECLAACEGEGCMGCLAVGVVAMAIFGIFVGVGYAINAIQHVVRKHMTVLWMRGEAQRIVVVDLAKHPEHLV